MAKKGGLEVVEALKESLTQDAFWGVRVEVADQLANIKLDQAGDALIAGLSNENPKVRRAIISSLSKVKTQASYDTLKQCLETGETSYYAEAAVASGLGSLISGNLKHQEEDAIALLKTVLEKRSGWNEVVRCGAINGLSQLKTSGNAVDIILSHTALGVPQPLRLGAIRALGGVSTGQTPDKLTEILDRLAAIAQESFFLTQVAVANALGQMETPKAINILQSLADQTPDGRVRRLAEEAIAKVQKNLGSDKAVKELREEIDKIKQENQDLKSRLAKLEAQTR